MRHERGSELDLSSKTLSASEFIASNTDAAKTFQRFRELTEDSTLWLSDKSKSFGFVELSGATQSGKLFHLWRVDGYMSSDHRADFLLIVGDIYTDLIDKATISEVVESRDGDGSAMSMTFSVPGDSGMSEYILDLSRTSCLLRLAGREAAVRDWDHIMTELEMVVAVEWANRAGNK